RDVGELRGDIAAADEDDALRQVLERQEILVRDGVLLPRNAERHGLGATGEDDVAGFDPRPLHGNLIRTAEACRSVEGIDAFLPIAALALRRDRIGESALERHEVAPRDRRVTADTVAGEAPRPPHRFGTRYQHLLGVAAAQRAGATERTEIDERDTAPGLPHPGRHARGRDAAADYNEIVVPAHARTAQSKPQARKQAQYEPTLLLVADAESTPVPAAHP